jgi:hypothetical protein
MNALRAVETVGTARDQVAASAREIFTDDAAMLEMKAIFSTYPHTLRFYRHIPF